MNAYIHAAVLLGLVSSAMQPATAAGPTPVGRTSAATVSLEDPRIRRVEYSADAVVTVHTRRGQVTHIVLAPDEQLLGDPATGQGADRKSVV